MTPGFPATAAGYRRAIAFLTTANYAVDRVLDGRRGELSAGIDSQQRSTPVSRWWWATDQSRRGA